MHFVLQQKSSPGSFESNKNHIGLKISNLKKKTDAQKSG